ncbi:hypothetical protein NDN08_003599 [Rhodosorus marinus]|uniref:Protein kinase domain-containing protein n=1 Tax=Rhodosorus marinus TaxID=101924 RepID=A0AAV8V190_9RHOD|nr:hypothetical protein NDN08_003599 [Rhodosorus marinus]
MNVQGLGYTITETIPSYSNAQVWGLQKGVKKETGEEALIFVYDPKSDKQGLKKRLAQSCQLRLKTFRHPDILKFITSTEGSDGSLHIATENAVPLADLMQKGSLTPEAIQWGLVCVSRALGFVHSGTLVHGSLSPASVFVTPSGDWKLGGFETIQPKDSVGNLRECIELQPEQYRPPEVARGMWSSLSNAPVHGIDAWALGCLIYAVHAGSFNSPEELRNINKLPKGLHPFYQQLLGSNAENRARCSDLPEFDYFKKAKFVDLNLFLDNLAIKDAFEKEAFLKRLPGMMEKLPRDFCVNKVLPVLCSSFDIGIGGSAAFSSIVGLKPRMTDEEFKRKVVDPHASKWYTNPNLSLQLKMELLQAINIFAKLFDPKEMNNKVFPALCNGFTDQTSPALRDLTIKTSVHVAPLLNERNLNSVLMAKFAALQVDPEPAIRTNTTVCIGKLASVMTVATRQKTLVPAFARAIKDPFPPARAAALSALLSTDEYYSATDIAMKLYPVVGPVLVDPETDVRASAFKLMKTWQPKLESYDAELKKRSAQTAQTAVNNGQQTNGQQQDSSWGFGSLSSMTSALIGTEDKPAGKTSATPEVGGGIPSTQAGSMVSAQAPMTSTVSSFDTGALAGGVDPGDEDDGWGDDVDFDDAFSKASAAPKQVSNPGGGLSLQGSQQIADPWAVGSGSAAQTNKGDDLWDLIPKSKPSTTSSKKNSNAKSADDDWGSILGPAGSTKKKGNPKLGAVRR